MAHDHSGIVSRGKWVGLGAMFIIFKMVLVVACCIGEQGESEMENKGSKLGGEWAFLVNTLSHGDRNPVPISNLSHTDPLPL